MEANNRCCRRSGRGATRRLALVWFAASVGCAATPATVGVPIAQGVAATRHAHAVAVSIRLEDEGVVAGFVIDAPVEHFAFSQIDHVHRDAWEMRTPGLTLAGSEITGAEPFSGFEILLRPDTEERDRVFPAVTRVGAGAVVYGPALDASDLHTILTLTAPEGGIAWPSASALSGYAYLGPDAGSGGSAARVIGGNTVAPWLARAVDHEVRSSLQFYTMMLGRPVDKATIFVSGDSPGPMSFHGDVTANSVIFLRFHGEQWQSPQPGSTEKTARFVRHEAFHLWNRDNAPGTPPWLHEGGAEYAAIVAAVDDGVLSQSQALEQVSSHLTRCRQVLEDRPMAELPRHGPAVYNCGVAAHWLADVELRSESGGRRTTFWLWRELLRRGDLASGYSLSDFRRLTGPLVSILIDAQPSNRWALLNTQLSEHAVVVSEEPSGADLRSDLLKHLLAEHCGGGPHGFWTEDNFVRLDTGDQCGPLSGDPEIDGVEGHDLFRSPLAAFEAVKRRCTQRREISLQRPQGPDLVVHCSKPPASPAVFNLRDGPALAIGRD